MTTPPCLWTIDELGSRVALALAVDYAGAPNGRVRGVPDLRTIRYYTTLGLLDRPAEMRGRTALYGQRHLLQLVAIKRLQATGHSLADIQRRLLGLPNAELERLAQLPPEIADASAPLSPVLGGEGLGVRGSASAGRSPLTPNPSPPSTGERGERVPTESAPLNSPDRAASFWKAVPTEPEPPAAAFQGIPLAEGVALLLTAGRSLTADDLEAIRTVAAPLLKLLDTRRLLARAKKGTSDDQTAADPQ